MISDRPRPYALDELAQREDAPDACAYPTYTAYLSGWHLWRALRRDGRLNPDECDAADSVVRDALSSAGARHAVAGS